MSAILHKISIHIVNIWIDTFVFGSGPSFGAQVSLREFFVFTMRHARQVRQVVLGVGDGLVPLFCILSTVSAQLQGFNVWKYGTLKAFKAKLPVLSPVVEFAHFRKFEFCCFGGGKLSGVPTPEVCWVHSVPRIRSCLVSFH